MNRRSFLSFLAAGLVGTAVDVDVDRLLWKPGEKTIFLPPAPPVALIDAEVGIALRFIKHYDTYHALSRLDILYGCRAIRPDMAVRILS